MFIIDEYIFSLSRGSFYIALGVVSTLFPGLVTLTTGSKTLVVNLGAYNRIIFSLLVYFISHYKLFQNQIFFHSYRSHCWLCKEKGKLFQMGLESKIRSDRTERLCYGYKHFEVSINLFNDAIINGFNRHV